MLIYQIDLERKNNFNINHKTISKSVLYVVEELLKKTIAIMMLLLEQCKNFIFILQEKSTISALFYDLKVCVNCFSI